MRVERYSDAVDFNAHVTALLERDEARYGLVQGILNQVMENPQSFGAVQPWFLSVNKGAETCSLALRTPPYNVLLAHFSGDPAASARRLVGEISALEQSLPGVNGERGIGGAFARLWCRTKGTRIKASQAQRIYRLVKVNQLTPSPGTFRPAFEKDRDLVMDWARAFHQEALAAVNPAEPFRDITDKIARQEIFFWESGVPRSMAAKARPTRRGMTVNYVYTPPESRGQGYATSCVAALCKNILDSGKEFCTLYADLANPTSNSIYRRIGFKKVCDSVMYVFAD